jgi:hypothetical protein
MRAKLMLRSTACIIQTNVPSASPRLGMLRNLYRLLAPPSAHTIYYHRARARVINYWHQGRQRATSVPPDHLQRNNEENRSRTARECHVVPVDIVAKANWSLDKLPNWWSLNRYEGFNTNTACVGPRQLVHRTSQAQLRPPMSGPADRIAVPGPRLVRAAVVTHKGTAVAVVSKLDRHQVL